MEKRETALILETKVANRYLCSVTNLACLESLWEVEVARSKNFE